MEPCNPVHTHGRAASFARALSLPANWLLTVAGRSMGKMGVIQGGGQWPNRLGRRCKEIIGDVGEDVIYDMYVQSSENAQLQAPENPEEEHALMFRYARCY